MILTLRQFTMLAFHQQPLKGFYLTYQLIATLFVRIPYWVLQVFSGMFSY